MTVNLATGTATGEGQDVLSGVESLLGTTKDDTFIGSAEPESFTPCGGNDIVDGAGGQDVIRFDYCAFQGVTVDLRTGVATGEGTDSISNVEDVIGTYLQDVIIGDEGPNRLRGSYGNDRLQGCAGDDVLSGDRGNDTASFACTGDAVTVDLGMGTAFGEGTDLLSLIENVQGSAGNDTIVGDAGRNVIFGLAGVDVLSGGGEDDVLRGGANSDTGDGGPHIQGDTCLTIEIRIDCEFGSSTSGPIARLRRPRWNRDVLRSHPG